MKRMRSVMFALLCSAMMFVGCEPDKPEEKPTPEEKPCFTFEITSTGKTEVTFKITPLDMETPYVAMIIDKAYYDNFASADDYIDDDLNWFEEVAMDNGQTLEEYLQEWLKTGVVEDSTEGLTPNTEYYLYAYHMNTAGDVISDLEKTLFTTADFGKADVSFEVTVEDIQYKSATVHVTPSSPTATYFINIFDDALLAEYGEGSVDAYKNHLVILREFYLGMGATTEQMIANLGSVGTSSLAFSDLTAGTKYYAYAIGVDEDFLPNTEARVVEFTTPSAEMSQLTFDVEITGVDYDHAEGTVTPSVDSETYICSIQLAESLDWYESDQEYMDMLIMDLEYWYGGVEASLRTGVTDLSTIAGLMPETEYVVLCFGYNQTPTTELFKFPFTTSAANGNPDDLEVTFRVVPEYLTHNSAYVEASPSVGVYYFMSLVEKWEFDFAVEDCGSVDAAVAYLANGEIDYGAEWFECTRAEYLADMGAVVGKYTMMFNQLTPSTEYVAYAVAVDMESGELASTKGSVSDPFKTLDKVTGAGTVEFVFGNYYDGSALAELDPQNFLNCKGYVLLPYEVVPNEEAMNWYTGFFASDYSEWLTSDDEIYDELITYGYEWDSEDVSLNRESGVAVLSYDYPYTFLGIAEDYDGNFGVGTMEVVTLTRDGVSPAQEFIDSLTSASIAPQKAPKADVHKKTPVVRKNLDKKGVVSKPQQKATKHNDTTKKQPNSKSHKRIIVG